MIQQAENGYYLRAEYMDEDEISVSTSHVIFATFRDLVEYMADMYEEEFTEGQVLKLIKKD